MNFSISPTPMDPYQNSDTPTVGPNNQPTPVNTNDINPDESKDDIENKDHNETTVLLSSQESIHVIFHQKSQINVKSVQFMNDPAASISEAIDFFNKHRDVAATDISRSGPNLRITVDGSSLTVNTQQLAQAMQRTPMRLAPAINPNSILAASLVVYEACEAQHLSGLTTRNVLRAFQQATANHVPVAQALRASQQNVASAAAVDAYLAEQGPGGFSKDMTHVNNYMKDCGNAANSTRYDLLRKAVADVHTSIGDVDNTGEYSQVLSAINTFLALANAAQESPYFKDQEAQRPANLADLRPIDNAQQAVFTPLVQPPVNHVQVQSQLVPVNWQMPPLSQQVSANGDIGPLYTADLEEMRKQGLDPSAPPLDDDQSKPYGGQFPQTFLRGAIDMRHEILGVFASPDMEVGVRGYLQPRPNLDIHLSTDSWDDFPQFLSDLKERQNATKMHVILDLDVHGNHGNGFTLVNFIEDEDKKDMTVNDKDSPNDLKIDEIQQSEQDPKDKKVNGSKKDAEDKKSKHADIASAAYILEQIQEAGFLPADITIVSEACNSGSVVQDTIKGYNFVTSNWAKTRAVLGGSSKTRTVDASSNNPRPNYVIIGRPYGQNHSPSVVLQYMSGFGLSDDLRQAEATRFTLPMDQTLIDQSVNDNGVVVDHRKQGKVSVNEDEVGPTPSQEGNLAAIVKGTDRRFYRPGLSIADGQNQPITLSDDELNQQNRFAERLNSATAVITSRVVKAWPMAMANTNQQGASLASVAHQLQGPLEQVTAARVNDAFATWRAAFNDNPNDFLDVALNQVDQFAETLAADIAQSAIAPFVTTIDRAVRAENPEHQDILAQIKAKQLEQQRQGVADKIKGVFTKVQPKSDEAKPSINPVAAKKAAINAVVLMEQDIKRIVRMSLIEMIALASNDPTIKLPQNHK